MLADEEFSDQPVSVCPVIAAFLRKHNDSIDDERRQDLYAYAAKVVGSRSPGPAQDERAARLSEWDSGVRHRQSTQSNVPWPRRALNRMLNAMFEEIPSYAFYGLTVHNDETHAEVLAPRRRAARHQAEPRRPPGRQRRAETRRRSLPPPALPDSAVTSGRFHVSNRSPRRPSATGRARSSGPGNPRTAASLWRRVPAAPCSGPVRSARPEQ